MIESDYPHLFLWNKNGDFANAQGGKIYIGKRDDGSITGIKNAKCLLNDLPNKMQSKLGIMADVNLLTDGESQRRLLC
mgnify:CR=1 FL=1|jgi:ATP-dependent DNA helicase RecG